jgi:hypothetical protein
VRAAGYLRRVQTPNKENEELLSQLIQNVEIAIQESSRLLSTLYVERGEHRHFALSYDEQSAKRYFLSQCLMDVQVSAGSQIRLVEHLRSASVSERTASTGLASLVLASILAEQSLWRRRLSEVLARLVLFSTTNTDANYYHYLLLVDAEESKRETENTDRDFGAKSATLARRANDLRQRLSTLSVRPPFWYARTRGKDEPLTLASAATVIRAALLKAVPREMTALGYSYAQSFSAPSQILHFSTTARRDSDRDAVKLVIATLALLSSAITTRIGALAELPTTLRLAPDEPAATPDLPDPGDFVVVTLDRETVFAAEVVESSAAAGVVGRVRVRFIGDAPYGDIVDDDFPSDLIHLIVRGADVMQRVRADLPAEFAVGDEELRASCRSAIEQAWSAGLRDMCRRQLRADDSR